MKSIKFLLLSLALIAHSAYPMVGVANGLKKYLPSLAGFTAVAVNIPFIGINVSTLHTLYNTQHCNLNKHAVVKELIDTYAPGKDINLYANEKAKGNAFASLNNTIFMGPEETIALQNATHPQHCAQRGLIGHEIGHLVNNDPRKNIALYSITSLATSTVLYRCFKSSAVKKIPTLLKPFIWTGAITTKIITDIGMALIRKKNMEKAADNHLMQHAKDPRDLRGIAQLFKTSEDIIASADTIGFLDTHEHPLVRAERFEKAADALEKRLAQQKSL